MTTTPVQNDAAANQPPNTPAGGGAGLEQSPIFGAGAGMLATLVLVVLWSRGVIRPAGLRALGVRPGAMGWSAGYWAVAGVGLYLLPQLAAALAMGVGGLSAGVEMTLSQQASVQLISYGCGLSAGAWIILRARRDGAGAELSGRVGDTLAGGLTLALTLPVLVGVGVISTLVYRLVSGEDPALLAHPTLEALSAHRDEPGAWAIVACAGLGAPVYEELVFRGLLQTALLRGTRSPVTAIVGSALVFTLAHAGGVPGYALPTIGVLGLALGIGYERTRSIVVPITAHVGFNALNLALVMLGG